ncbi:hypothetical protein KVR801_250006 [Klebsiella variicola]|nr:hypothetical protein KVR801_250006 [Klebsiella variicola]
MLPTPGMSAVPQAKKKPVHAYELFLKYGGEGGIDSLRSPLLGPSMGLAPAGPTQAFLSGQPARRLAVCPTGVASCRIPVGGSHPPQWKI